MQDLSQADDENILYKDVVIVGNGPGGIFLSYLLNGNWPYYTGQPHPGDEMLSARLEFVVEKATNRFKEDNDDGKKIIQTINRRNHSIKNELYGTVDKKSLLEIPQRDLEILASGVEGRGTCRPLALLLDQLQHPCVDAGLNLPSLLVWKSAEYHPKQKIIDHVSLGKGPPGGAWQFMDPNILTISLDRWMSLPGLEIQEWESMIEAEQSRKSAMLRECIGDKRLLLSQTKVNRSNEMRRILVGSVAAYYKDYVVKQGLAKYFKSGRIVTSVRPILEVDNHDKEYGWIVQGYENLSGKRFHYKCKNVVIATGTTNSFNRLGIAGEETQSCWVTHQLNDFETRLDRLVGKCKKCAAKRKNQDLSQIDPVLVIGAGLSAADAIMAARNRGIPVIHAFRESTDLADDNLNNVKLTTSIYDRLRSLPVSMYPEYHEVYEMMVDDKTHRLYKALPGYTVIDLGVKSDDTNKTKERTVSLQSPDGNIYRYRVSIVAILIGAKPDLSYLGEYAEKFGRIVDKPIDGRSNPIEIDDFTYEVVRSPCKGLYAIGPLVGDNFVRFILGGAFGVAAHLIRNLDID
ncbi:hypothetical protein PV327_007956 [Microctonus hyperodae]|uniref:FAD/NAD(P)-binding domain-containing protein n=1 Tax=Microctonus hyperodae TaxID=165561 RepID=A0AA39G0B2_MICHY|nr:hypothetical protein PV327_007956 [Microctonus hyperodae]